MLILRNIDYKNIFMFSKKNYTNWTIFHNLDIDNNEYNINDIYNTFVKYVHKIIKKKILNIKNQPASDEEKENFLNVLSLNPPVTFDSINNILIFNERLELSEIYYLFTYFNPFVEY
ncbi:putative non-structural protein [Betaentomopoxvirus amoorei]|uniref:AMV042 n=1 Tax=Amsacta moorei entomopoxvirus TaxID=28321 RepID=Q9EN06_AMEPV|nr:putative non-structural protein [Amsacta moorei entomopoxvirus]AAG02748.1 AMV042 [Amsacta moorei entomopoxvirus]